MIPLELTVD